MNATQNCPVEVGQMLYGGEICRITSDACGWLVWTRPDNTGEPTACHRVDWDEKPNPEN